MSSNPSSPQPPFAAGRPAPLGATVVPDGVNFAVFSKYATSVQLLLFDDPEAPTPARVVDLDPVRHRTHYYWHVLVPGLGHGQVYAWRLDGPRRPDLGHRFDPGKVLLDPYGKAVAGGAVYRREDARRPGDNAAAALRSVVIDDARFDWGDDRPLGRPAGREIIYELHVGGFTASPTSGVPPQRRGTYAGLIEKIPHLLELGVNTVELLPVHHFDPQDSPPGLTNYWGYSTVGYFAPHGPYSSDPDPAGAVTEFKAMVRALHAAGLRVILDVVYNHTAEGGADGPLLSWRGFENSAYYLLDPADRARFLDYTGCGNTVNANHSIVRRLILDSLLYWAEQMHVDGFRFDLASALSRGEDGQPQASAPILWAIESEPRLSQARLIAEPWDAAGLYQVGAFTGDRFSEWNGPFRDDVRRFWRGDDDTIERLMARIVGSPDLFSGPDDRPSGGVNFVTCHDGFTLADLVAYEQKRNLANGEQNRDGSDHNLSWNCGVEGPSDDPAVQALRERQMRNFLVLLFLSLGTPMFPMGDEVGHTRRGNNNPWCQDSELNWLDWARVESRPPLLRFLRELIRFSQGLALFREDRFWTATSPEEAGEVSWHGLRPGLPDWSAASRQLAYTLDHPASGQRVCVLLNAGTEALEFMLPAPAATAWRLVIDTAAAPPQDIHPAAEAPAWSQPRIRLTAHSAQVLISGPPTV